MVAARQNNFFFAMLCNSKLHAIILWCVISMKLNICQKIAGLEIMTLNPKKYVSKLTKLMFKWEFKSEHIFQICTD